MDNISKQLQKSKNHKGKQIKVAGLKVIIGQSAVKSSSTTTKDTVKALENIRRNSLFTFGI